MSTDETPLSDQIKKVVDDLDLENKVRDAAAAAEQVVVRGLEATGSYLREHRGDIEGFLERAVGAIDRQTGGRYADQVEQVRGQLVAGVASLADREWGVQAPPTPAELTAADETPAHRGSRTGGARRRRLGRLHRPGLTTYEGPDPVGVRAFSRG